MKPESNPVKMETQTDLEQQKVTTTSTTTSTEKAEQSVICNRDSRLRYVLMIIATVFCIAIITLSFYLANILK